MKAKASQKGDNFECLVEWKYNFCHVKVEAFNTNSSPCHRFRKRCFPQRFFRPFLVMIFLTLSFAQQYLCTLAKKHGDQQFSTDRAEMSAFFGLNILMGINQLPNKRLCWDSNPFLGNAGFKKTISLKHFKLLSRYFHISITEHEEATRQI